MTGNLSLTLCPHFMLRNVRQCEKENVQWWSEVCAGLFLVKSVLYAVASFCVVLLCFQKSECSACGMQHVYISRPIIFREQLYKQFNACPWVLSKTPADSLLHTNSGVTLTVSADQGLASGSPDMVAFLNSSNWITNTCWLYILCVFPFYYKFHHLTFIYQRQFASTTVCLSIC